MKPGPGLADRLDAFRSLAVEEGWLAPAGPHDALLTAVSAELRAAQAAVERLERDRLSWFEAAGRRLVERDALAAALEELLAGVSGEQISAVEAARDALRRFRDPD